MDGTRADAAAARNDQRCPHCTDSRIQRWGKPNGSQRYRCRNCGRTFNALTGTACAGLRRAELWVDYRAAIVEQLSIRKAAERCGIDPSTALRWRRRLTSDPSAPSASRTARRPSTVASQTAPADQREAVDFVDWVHAVRANDGGGSMRARLDEMFGMGPATSKGAGPALGTRNLPHQTRRPGKPLR